jgi:hypothetical protein
MNAEGTRQKKKGNRRALWRVNDMIPRELLAFCPACKALDVLRFTGSEMVPTRKFEQRRGRVYHSCGSRLPCRLHSSIARDQRADRDRGSLVGLSVYAARTNASPIVPRPATRRAKVPAAA